MSRTNKCPVVFRLIFKAYDHKLLADLCLRITADLQSEGYSARTVSLPTKIRKYCVLTSPHVYKKAREQFEIRTHKRIVDIDRPPLSLDNNKMYYGTHSFLDQLKKMEIPAGVDIRVKLVHF